MIVKIFPLDFMGEGALLQPRDQKLHDMAVEFCAKEVTGEVNLSQFSKVFIAAGVDAEDNLVSIEGISGYVLRPDISLYRAISNAATVKLHHRWHTFFADNGILGKEVFIHLSDKDTPEQRCANWEGEILSAQATPAERFLVKVRAK